MHVDRYPSECFGDISHVFLILGAVECACRVYEIAAGLQSLPHIVDNRALQCRTLLYKCGRPLFHRRSLLAHHPLARAWHVGSYDIGDGAEAGVAGCIA